MASGVSKPLWIQIDPASPLGSQGGRLQGYQNPCGFKWDSDDEGLCLVCGGIKTPVDSNGGEQEDFSDRLKRLQGDQNPCEFKYEREVTHDNVVSGDQNPRGFKQISES